MSDHCGTSRRLLSRARDAMEEPQGRANPEKLFPPESLSHVGIFFP